VTIEEVYPHKPELANKHGGVVLVGDDLLFGDSDDAGIVFCADLMTGEVNWKKRGPGRGSASVVAADGRLYVRYADGVMALVNVDKSDFIESGSFKIPGSGERPSWSHPVVVGGRLYLREQDAILCYDVTSN
jgi:outer membrane protein assembly factor BamB